MSLHDEFRAYQARFELTPAGHKELDQGQFEQLHDEHQRLRRRWDPDDIQLDEWKRMDELLYLLLLNEEDEA